MRRRVVSWGCELFHAEASCSMRRRVVPWGGELFHGEASYSMQRRVVPCGGTHKTTKLIAVFFSELGERARKGLDIGSVYTLFVAALLNVLVPYWWQNSVFTCTCCCSCFKLYLFKHNKQDTTLHNGIYYYTALPGC